MGVRLVLTLTNNWPDYGGMQQYVSRYVTHRFNPYTKLRYNEDPTIMAFELANEPRSRSDKTGVGCSPGFES